MTLTTDNFTLRQPKRRTTMITNSNIHFHSPPPPPQQQQQQSESTFESNCRARIQDLLGGIADGSLLSLSSPLPDVVLPSLKYGFRNIPAPWTELVQIIQTNDIARLARSESQQREYEIFRYYLKRHYHSIVDFVLCTKFNVPKRWNDDTKVWEADKDNTDEKNNADNNDMMVLVPNDFPYSMQTGIIHYILWKRTKITPNDVEMAKAELKKQLNTKDIVYWVNPPNLKSLPEIDHVHFLCLLEDERSSSPTK